MLHDSSSGARPRTAIPPVERRTVTEEVLTRLRDLLLRGALRPGTRIDQAELARAFGVSTVPIREALLRLQSAGLVQSVPHRGVFVSEVSVDELIDIHTTRELLEEQAARLAVERLTSTDLQALEQVTRTMQAAAAQGQLDELLKLHREFHFTIYRAAGRRHLLQLIEQLWDLSARYAHLQLHAAPDRASEALQELRSILAACRRRDTNGVGSMVRHKVHQTTVGLLEHMAPASTPVPKQLGEGYSKAEKGTRKRATRASQTRLRAPASNKRAKEAKNPPSASGRKRGRPAKRKGPNAP